MPQSLNFTRHSTFPQVDQWGADAEQFIVERPDLTLVRARQLVELLVRAVETRSGTRGGRNLAARLDHLSRADVLDSREAKSLHWVRRKANDALHVATLRPVGPGAWHRDARRALRHVASAWAWFDEVPARDDLQWPVDPDVLSRKLARVHEHLDRAEESLVYARDYDRVESIVDGGDIAALKELGATELQIARVMLRQDSVRLAVSNHRGLSPPQVDVTRSRRLVASGDPAAIDDVVRLHNRRAVGLLNRLQLSEALSEVEGFEQWRAATPAMAPAAFEDVLIRDSQRGRLLGTKGQILAMLGHAYRLPAKAREALECFQLARTCFANDEDIERQETYTLHGLVEIVRVDGEFSAQERARVVEAIAEAPVEALADAPWSPSSFRVALALKAARVLGQPVPWLQRLAGVLTARAKEGGLHHPYIQLAGGVAILDAQCPRRVRQALHAAAERPGLEGWIARSYVAASEREGSPVEPPEMIRSWWDAYEMETLSQRRGPLAVLPFNYC